MSLLKEDERVEALRQAETGRIEIAAAAIRKEADAANARWLERQCIENLAPLSYQELIQELHRLIKEYNQNAPTPLIVEDTPYSFSFRFPGFYISLTNGPLYCGKLGGHGVMIGIDARRVHPGAMLSKLGALEFRAELVPNEGIHWRRGKQSVNTSEIANLVWHALVTRKCEGWEQPLYAHYR